MIRENFENNMQELENKLAEMVRITEEQLECSYQALETQDIELALKTIEKDNTIDDMEKEINQMAIWFISKEQPLARDLRRIIGVLKISSDIERIADFAVNISKATIKIGERPSLLDMTKLEPMKTVSITMLQKSLKSFVDEDIALAKEVADLDDLVDANSRTNYQNLIQYLSEHPEDTAQLVQLLFINRFLERTADHITNIAESTAYLIKGRMYDFN
ncbi:phosphate signaling complex protein PhoU [Psychrobacillus sp. BL-248-WT-3]|uniref:phosphate signaling complex protein PhoU n=1 Tax=Psychrobacillus sp. BL-248-WT-3 TaxID=2725306 RepID=UPI00146F82F4|nr:phosphate signaling complex protein PhoU [Psychrobacillus sp. BL-248-WT-3]NME07621.1 phosphate signaling complex protein PhoU [Psychrobacillus sp. BL-248-WT-3]